eukprot:1185466-Pleurochrysis_carterae.AAC.2
MAQRRAYMGTESTRSCTSLVSDSGLSLIQSKRSRALQRLWFLGSVRPKLAGQLKISKRSITECGNDAS